MFGLLAARSRYNHNTPVVVYDPYWGNVVSLLHFDGASGATTFTDQKGVVWTANGGAAIDTASPLLGTGSLKLDGTGDYISAPSADSFAFGTGDFTVEWFASQDSAKAISHIDFRGGTSSSPRLMVYNNTTSPYTDLRLYVNGADVITAPTGTLIIGQRQHFAICRVSGITRLFVDGVQVGSSWTDTTNYTPAVWNIGRNSVTTTRDFNGHIDEFRATKGIGRYSSNFTPPATAFPNIGPADPYWDSVTSLLHFDGPDTSTTFTDQKGITWAAGGNAKLRIAKSKFGSASGYFDGAGDYVRAATAPGYDFGSGDFTIEFFANPDSITAANEFRGIVTRRSTINQFAFGVFQTQNNGGFSATFSSSGVGNDVALGPSGAITAATWYHVAVTRQGNTWRLFVGGVLLSTATSSISIYSGINFANIGVLDDGSANNGLYFKGYIDDLRITKGLARYTANFTPPDRAFPDR